MAKTIFKRELYDSMLQWKENKRGQSALLIKGARRVGKTTLVENFAKNEYRTYIRIDFSKTSRQVDELFEDMMDLDFFFIRLQNIFHITLYKRQSAIIFDEVQLKPLARQAIKHLVADGRYDYIETGSLLTLKKNVQNIVIPSEETQLTLHPLTLSEFYTAIGKATAVEQLKQAFAMHRPMGNAVHRQWMRELRLYMLVGGMPQSVDAYLQHNNLQVVDEVKRSILDLYDGDFRKIDETGNASAIFRDIPAQLTSNASRYQVSKVLDARLSTRTETVIADMEDSMVVNLAHHANDPSVGMRLSKDLSRFKMFMADTGLFITLAFRDKTYTDNIIYNQLLSDKLAANLGYVYENLVAQILRSTGNDLYYYTFPTEDGKRNYEIDFLLSRGNKICPIEIKSSGYRTHRSLDLFCEKYSDRIGDRYLLYTKDYAHDGQVQCIPAYFSGLL